MQRRLELVVGVGIYVVDIREFRAGLTEDLADEFFLPGETGYARTQVRSWENLGARLAAKRAVFDALGAASSSVWHEVEVLRGDSGELDVRLSGGTLALAERLGVSRCNLSMTHTRETAMAVAILEDGSR